MDQGSGGPDLSPDRTGSAPKKWTEPVLWLAVCAGLILGGSAGCQLDSRARLRTIARVASIGLPEVAKVERVKRPRRIGPLGKWAFHAPLPSERTQQLLRRYNLMERYRSEPDYVIRWMQDICRATPNMEEVHALAELALIQGQWLTRTGDDLEAQEMFATAVVHAYQFLFDSSLDIQRNAYDPQFRRICDVYNLALEGMLRSLCAHEGIENGVVYRLGKGEQVFELRIELKGRWKDDEFEKFELVNDYEMQGITNRYHTYGLGVPLLAVHKKSFREGTSSEYYPPRLTLPMTGFCEVYPGETSFDEEGKPRKIRTAVLTLYDPLEETNVMVEGRTVPLESDITTPLAYHLNDPLLNTGVLETLSMFNANLGADLYGLFLLEPYDPNKIPVVMVHGLWSGPVTWLEMFNDLRANRELRNNYQFWFYAYPTGQPFWISARQMRQDLATLRSDLDPYREASALDQMVLVGHSMGGLVSRLQTIESGDEFWRLISKTDVGEWDGNPEALAKLKGTFIFEPNSQVKRVITLASPHQGSRLANNVTQWVSRKLFTLPDIITNDIDQLAIRNSGKVANRKLLTMSTSIDALSPDSPFIQSMNAIPLNPAVHFHNIVGNAPPENPLQKAGLFFDEGDGVVSLESANAIAAESRVEVPAEHQKVHQHPRSILEVRRILLEHLVETERISSADSLVIPTDFEQISPGHSRVEHAVVK